MSTLTKKLNQYTVTDMAIERLPESHGGVTVREETVNGFHIHRLTLKKPCESIAEPGRYITLTVGRPWLESCDRIAEAAELLSKLILEACPPNGTQSPTPRSALILCLGNRKITADSIGPLCADGLVATRHLKNERPEIWRELGEVDLSALAPGVSGSTGMEACELALAAVKTTHPQVVITVDALSARDTARLGTSIQITDVGLAPGSGVGNHRMAISEKSLGVPVISIGVPMVAHSATLISDALESSGFMPDEGNIEAALNVGREFFVTPRDCDIAAMTMAEIISRAVNLAFLGFQKL